MSDDDHGIDVEENTDLDTAAVDEHEPPEEVEQENPDREPGREDADSEVREAEAADQENVDNHRDEEPFES
jgi:hypothetical protein